MRKIVLQMSVSLDGFFEGPDGDIGWHRVDDELHEHFNEELGAMSAFLEGRRSYELMEAFWPTADADPASTGPMVEFARIWRETPKLVFSRTLQQVGPNAELVREVDAGRIRELAAQPGGDMAVGGAELATEFRRLGLVDEYQIYVHPVLLGKGRPLFAEAEGRTDLRLVETRTLGNGVVLLRHAREAG
ncbi:dihydrofolate reductase family protein [Geodermatophilus marinus]|uniref:dihydrofolate reductase family protein n=1 Tax=Geodermatophilus sp. LHW52908 TaxID=2303986 RepID=UPI000E3E1268|nr:dihydrofolate reductase family protein [Geodermatophilus sp. LHW52908]RFU23483.1 dihydrofolate reductase [Geodermatophilus sp. LHW52908]